MNSILKIMRVKLLSNRRILILLICLIIFLIFVKFLKYYVQTQNDKEDLLLELKQKQLKSIQLLTGRFHFKNWKLGHELGEVPFEKCAEKRCHAFRSFVVQEPLERSDAVMVHAPNLWYMPDRRKYKRNPRQLWYFYTIEPQGLSFCSSHFNLNELDDWFNVTATFKADSDFLADYKEFRQWSDVESDASYVNEFKKLLKKNTQPVSTITDLTVKNRKKASIIWYVSHCETFSRREDYVKELMNYIDVDIYGNCGSYFQKSRQDPCAGIEEKKAFFECLNRLLNGYKFTLAFENSLCDEYISEKFWKIYYSSTIFEVNIVPVVRGAKQRDYLKVTHQNSFINVDNFKTPKDLADYLIYLNGNNSAYLQFFDWKIKIYERMRKSVREEKEYGFSWSVSSDYHLRESFCRLCSLLHNETYLSSKSNKVWKISEWFSKETNCWDQDEPRLMLKNIFKFAGWCI